MEAVKIARGSKRQLGKMIKEEFKDKAPLRIGIITDINVANLYLEAVSQALIAEGYQVWTYALKAGDQSKSMESLNEILCAMAREGFNRQDLLLALGGGVPGDIAGFAASIYMRGLSYIQVPTTLLAAIDSSVGGKTGINLACGKNMAGSFWPPAFTLIDPEFLLTLPKEVYRDGLAEAVKYGVIGSPHIWKQIRKLGSTMPLDPKIVDQDQQMELIRSCVDIKMKIVEEDQRDYGRRMLLNFGHTIGHAIEQASNYQTSHGEAVALGMVLESKWTYEMGLTPRDWSSQIKEILLETGFSMDLEKIKDKDLYQFMAMDKKHQASSITIVVPRDLGACDLMKIDKDQLRQFDPAFKGWNV